MFAPTSLRGGLLWEARISVHAHRDIKNAILVLHGGWLDGFTMNTLLPSPLGESSRDGKLVLTVGERLTPADVSEEARQNQIDSLEKVTWAVLEPNGSISFIEK